MEFRNSFAVFCGSIEDGGERVVDTIVEMFFYIDVFGRGTSTLISSSSVCHIG